MARVACLVIAGEGDIVLGSAAASLGWTTVGGAALLSCAALLTAAGCWVAARLGGPHVVVGADARGIILGPSLGQLLRLHRVPSTSRVLPWANVRRLQVLVREARVTDSGMAARQRHLRLTTDDGWWIERTLPITTDLTALERVIRTYKPSLHLEVTAEAANKT
jgi:hypothetical protein